ncbi:MAG TPA: hypothetical protein VF444_18185 [Pseudonocardiaceae bacterium]
MNYPQPGGPQYPPPYPPQQPYPAGQRAPQLPQSQPAPQQPQAKRQRKQPKPKLVNPHGASNDPRYPSPRRLRRVFAFIVDFALHLGCAAAAIPASDRIPGLFIIVWVLSSFIHRVFIQRMTQTTLGKAIFGLCLIRREDGGHPRIGQLIWAWFSGIFVGIAILGALGGNFDGGADEDAFLPAVRRRDVRHLRLSGQQ